MRAITRTISIRQGTLLLVAAAAVLIGVLLRPATIRAQRNAPPSSLAQVGPAAPLPVYVTNNPPSQVPDGFVPGSIWKFTTWTIPSTLSFTATVKDVDGGWAQLNLSTDPPTSAKWYFIPYMPGVWERQ
jgi:hypothetical protein